jgi:hypothetical protein
MLGAVLLFIVPISYDPSGRGTDDLYENLDERKGHEMKGVEGGMLLARLWLGLGTVSGEIGWWLACQCEAERQATAHGDNTKIGHL